MTIGIYILYWDELDVVYVGKSQRIEDRFKEHLRDLKNNSHHNYKVQNLYNTYGIPNHSVLEITNIEDLSYKEDLWIKEFDAINSGLNIIEAKNLGTNSTGSIYTRHSILKAFSLLYRTLKPYKEVAKIAKISDRVCTHLVNSNEHMWLKEKYPEKYAIMKQNAAKRIENAKKSLNKYSGIKLISPEGDIITIDSVRNIAKKYLLNQSSLNDLVRGRQPSYKGWKVTQEVN